jgi:hypothetical protein
MLLCWAHRGLPAEVQLTHKPCLSVQLAVTSKQQRPTQLTVSQLWQQHFSGGTRGRLAEIHPSSLVLLNGAHSRMRVHMHRSFVWTHALLCTPDSTVQLLSAGL